MGMQTLVAATSVFGTQRWPAPQARSDTHVTAHVLDDPSADAHTPRAQSSVSSHRDPMPFGGVAKRQDPTMHDIALGHATLGVQDGAQ